MILPSGGFFVLALWLLLVNRLRQWQASQAGATEEAAR